MNKPKGDTSDIEAISLDEDEFEESSRAITIRIPQIQPYQAPSVPDPAPTPPTISQKIVNSIIQLCDFLYESTFDVESFQNGRVLELLTSENFKICSIRGFSETNNNQPVYLLSLPNDRDILLPIPLSKGEVDKIFIGKNPTRILDGLEAVNAAKDFNDETSDYCFSISIDKTGRIKIKPNTKTSKIKLALRDKPIKISNLTLSEIGKDHYIGGNLDANRRIFGLSVKEAGLSKYSNSNEDSIGYNSLNGRVVLADGMGGYGNGEFASNYAAKKILVNPNNLSDAIIEASDDLELLTQFLPDGQKADTVLVAAEFKDNTLRTVVLGDSFWVLIREGKIIARSIEHSLSETYYRQGQIKYEEKFDHEERHLVLTTIRTACYPDFGYEQNITDAHDSKEIIPQENKIIFHEGSETWKYVTDPITLQKGDIWIAMSDGCNCLTPKEIVEATKSHGAENWTGKHITVELLRIVSNKNFHGSYKIDLPDGTEGTDNTDGKTGKTIEVGSPCDNTSIITVEQN